jgi:hypothetical protein
MNIRMRIAVVTAALLAAVAAPVVGQRPTLTMLDHIDGGRWELRVRGAAAPAERICLQNARSLIQLRHPAETCDRLIINDGATDVTVQYTCHGRGYGRTHIRRETSRLFQIETQGIAHGLPFSYAAEARRIGDCAT